jgi:putative nucleotidyltransferase with HDIG domain
MTAVSGGWVPFGGSRGAHDLQAPHPSVWGRSLRASDGHTYQHCQRVAGYAVAIAVALDLEGPQLDAVRLGASLHDIGKIRLPPAILHKRGRLSLAEYELVKRHPIWGLDVLAGTDLPLEVRSVIRWHHEKRDGSGYPDGLRGDDIPLHPMIIGIADVYDALTTWRSYRPALPQERALAEMRAHRSWWHPEVYLAFQRAIAQPATRGGCRGGSRNAAVADLVLSAAAAD